jgi:hypothetical protein
LVQIIWRFEPAKTDAVKLGKKGIENSEWLKNKHLA